MNSKAQNNQLTPYSNTKAPKYIPSPPPGNTLIKNSYQNWMISNTNISNNYNNASSLQQKLGQPARGGGVVGSAALRLNHANNPTDPQIWESKRIMKSKALGISLTNRWYSS